MYGNYHNLDDLRKFAYNFFISKEKYNENIMFSFDENDMDSIKETGRNLDTTIDLFDKIWMEMTYEETKKKCEEYESECYYINKLNNHFLLI